MLLAIDIEMEQVTLVSSQMSPIALVPNVLSADPFLLEAAALAFESMLVGKF